MLHHSGSWCLTCESATQFACQSSHSIVKLTGGMLEVGKLLVAIAPKLNEAVVKRRQLHNELSALKTSTTKMRVLVYPKIQENDDSLTLLRESIESFNQIKDVFPLNNKGHERTKKKLESIILETTKDITSANRMMYRLVEEIRKIIDRDS